jgi:hypothetical protein
MICQLEKIIETIQCFFDAGISEEKIPDKTTFKFSNRSFQDTFFDE